MPFTAVLGTSDARLENIILESAGTSPPPPPPASSFVPQNVYQAAPPGLMHPKAFLRARPPMVLPPSSATSPIAAPPTITMPPYVAAPRGMLHPTNAFFRRVPDVVPRFACSLPTPPIPQVYPPQYTGGPIPGPWSKQQLLPGQAAPPLVPPPPPPPVISPDIYQPQYHRGPVAGPWQRGPGPVAPPFMPPAEPAGGPPGPVPNPPRKGGESSLIPRCVGTGIDERLRRHTDRVADVLNSLVNRAEIVKVGAKDYALAAAHVDGIPPTVNDDITLGYLRGTTWIDTTGGNAWICIDNAAGSALWKVMTV